MLEHPKTISARIAVRGSEEAAASGAQAIDRSATLLLLVGRAGPLGARLSDLVGQCGLSNPPVRGILLARVRGGLLDRARTTRRYYLGPEISAGSCSRWCARAFSTR